MTVRHVVTWNMPGCLPESDPAEFDNRKDARDYLISVFRDWGAADGPHSAEFEDKADRMELSGDAEAFSDDFYWDAPDGYVYSIERWDD